MNGAIFMRYLERLAELREDHHKRQTDVAKILNTSQQQYSLYEVGDRKMPIDKLAKLADYYNVSVDYILKRTDYPMVIEQQYVVDSELKKFILYYTSLNETNRDIILGEMARLSKAQTEE
jgi:transcriptional regulator with XRE-family HTH domain